MFLPCLPMCLWMKPYSYSLIWLSRTIGSMKRTKFISVEKTLSIFSKQQLKVNFSFSMVSCMNKQTNPPLQTVSLWDPLSVLYSLMCLCVALKKDWSRKARCPHTTGDLLVTHRPSFETKHLWRIFLETFNQCHSSVMFTVEI
ncbi:unnamed protein product, partial [Porites lobata]